MRRTIPILSGLAILCVILNHSNWHVLRDIPVGDLAGALPFLFLDQLTKFAVPAYVFIAGYFIAYATSEGKKELRWEITRARMEGLLWPWLVWTVFLMAEQLYKGSPLSVVLLMQTLFVQYYFVPLLMFFYLSSTIVVRWVKASPIKTLIWAGVIQLAMIALFYVRAYWSGFPINLDTWIDIGLLQYLRFSIYFPLGVAAGIFGREMRPRLAPLRPILPWLIVVAYGLQMAEVIFAFSLGADTFPIGGDQTRLSSALFSVAILLTFIAYERITVPLSKQVQYAGTNSFGLYLSHYALLGVISYMVREFFPGLVQIPALFIPLLYVLSLGAAVILLEISKRLPIKGVHRFVFG